MISSYTQAVIESFTFHADQSQALVMQKYLKNKFDFFGIKAPLRREISKFFMEKDHLPKMSEATEIVIELWDQPQRELQYLAIELLRKYGRKSPPDWIILYEKLITTKSWWDTVDGLAAWHVGDHFLKYPDLMPEYTSSWMNSGNIWLQRTCLLFQLMYKEKTDFQLLNSFIISLAGSKEFFIKKAIGWSLRQYAKSNPEVVLDFVNKQPLAPLSYREAVRTICK
jgi:3-methyladenine DNA glycosylase AlkD